MTIPRHNSPTCTSGRHAHGHAYHRPTTPLRVVARLMAEQRVHAVAVADADHARRPWGIITDLEVAAAAAEEADQTAGEAAKHEVVTISATTR